MKTFLQRLALVIIEHFKGIVEVYIFNPRDTVPLSSVGILLSKSKYMCVVKD